MLEQAYTYVRWFVREVVRQFIEYRCLDSAAALTCTTLFALVPVMTVTYAILSAFPEWAGVGELVESFVFENFVPDVSASVTEKLAEFSDQARQLGVVGGVIVLFTAFWTLITIEKAFNLIWQVPEPRKGMQRLLVYWGVLTFGPPMLLGALSATSYLYTLPLLTDLDVVGVRAWLLTMVPTFAFTATFTVLYYAVPNTYVPFKHALLGGVLTMLMFVLARWLFAEFVVQSGTAVIYGTFAAIPFFLIWLYLVWTMVLSGAVFVRTLSLRGDVDDEHREPLVLQCARVLGVLHQAHLKGESVTNDAIDAAVTLNRSDHERVFEVLTAEKLIKHTEDERLTLGRSLKTVTLWDLYLKLPEALDVEGLEQAEGMDGATRRLRSFAKFGTNELSVTFDELFAEMR